jgi:nicotinamide mononucleotide adenylyltransferase
MLKHVKKSQQRSSALRTLAEQRAAKKEESEKILKEEATQRSFTSFKSLRAKKQSKIQERKNLHIQALKESVAEIVRNACPIEGMKETPIERVVQAINECVDNFRSVVVHNPFEVLREQSSHYRVVEIGGANKSTPADLINKVAAMRVDYDPHFNYPGEGQVEKVYKSLNVVDTVTARGGNADEKHIYMNEGIAAALVGKMSETIRDKVVKSYANEVQRIQNSVAFNEDVMTEGLNPIAAKNMKERIRKENNAHNITREIFSTVKIMNEHTSGSAEDFLNETVLNMTILESLNMFGLVESDVNTFALKMRNARKEYMERSSTELV